jgi:ATP synthase F1 gamma subunit
VFTSVIENEAAEMAARMTSMDNASKNSQEMIKKLTVLYNRRRQAVITTELAELISGAAAVENADAD